MKESYRQCFKSGVCVSFQLAMEGVVGVCSLGGWPAGDMGFWEGGFEFAGDSGEA